MLGYGHTPRPGPAGPRACPFGAEDDDRALGNHERVDDACIRTISDRGTATITGQKPWEFDGQGSSGDLEMHAALIRSIREGKPINEGVRLAEATMTGVMGRMSAYTGRALKWDWAMNASKLDLRPAKYEMGPLPVEPVAMPGRTPLV